MKPEFENISLKKDDDKKHFELEVNGHTAFIEYDVDEDSIVSLIHTEAPTELAGTGAAAALVEKTFLLLEVENKEIQPFCPYIFAYIKKHPEWKRLVYKGFPGYHRL
ncbi:GNAT family N-acetyltransferase [Niabella ginsengisoli]|uniref:N-acetyltransferase n=1 Tax=Niabella ginsengisoli TaxID=522298 RepID=A0ABS9SPV3_9BACT|nr:N-acetyltransferase [Niabella ginsengisoli]MCH5600296.1 N-acetyltransferase [Niabella ginsengisoli]